MRLVMFLAAALAFSSPASAQWVFDKSTDAFENPTVYAATGDGSGYFMGVRCLSNKTLSVRFMTTEKVTDAGTRDAIQKLGSDLLLRIDDAPIKTVVSAVGFIEDTFVLDAAIDVDVAYAMATAKRRIAVAADLSGNRVHQVEFSTQGSNATIPRVIEACKK